MYSRIPEEELGNKVATDFFQAFDCTEIIGKIDFSVKLKSNKRTSEDNATKSLPPQFVLWATAKSAITNPVTMLTQLVLTIGKSKIFEKTAPPRFLGCIDCEKLVLIQYSDIQHMFYQNDFNWRITPSDRNSREFKLVHNKIENVLKDSSTHVFYFVKHNKELKSFIKNNFVASEDKPTGKFSINKANFKWVYDKWVVEVKPTINAEWEYIKRVGLLDADFYLADLLSEGNNTIAEKLFVLLRIDHYEADKTIQEDYGLATASSKAVSFKDGQNAHKQFWEKYERPPKPEYWDYIIHRRDLLVPQDIRERKGSFYTPQTWVELSQQYLAKVLGDNWQDDYYVWDCAAGTGNLLAGLTNPRRIWASTIDRADVDVMKERINNGAILLENHVFQFDFLNDDFDTLPSELRSIVQDKEKRKKLIVYINPPYAEVATSRTIVGTRKNRIGIAESKMHEKYANTLGKARNELYSHFLIRVYTEISGCFLANFSTLKNLQGINFKEFRQVFQPKLERLFLVPADTFDNVTGKFPIGFYIWDTNQKEQFDKIAADVYNDKGVFCGQRLILATPIDRKSLTQWIVSHLDKQSESIGLIVSAPPSVQSTNILCICSKAQARHCYSITANNLIQAAIYFAVRHCIVATWLNDRDQFLFPDDSWERDTQFQSNCLAFALFHNQNNITNKHGTNHWIPFTERELGLKVSFTSGFMAEYFAGRKVIKTVFGPNNPKQQRIQFSSEATSVFNAGRNLWKYYLQQPGVEHTNALHVNASLYDIREFFQGRNEQGRMNSKSADPKYNELIGALRESVKALGKIIEPKVYEHGFLQKL